MKYKIYDVNEIKNIENEYGFEFCLDDKKLHKNFKLKNFKEAFAFLTEIAIISEKLNHHADIYNLYNIVKIGINTHDVDGITDLDEKFIKLVAKSFKKYE